MTGPVTRAAGRPVVPRAPFSRPGTAATGRPERPDPCTDPPTVRLDPTRVLGAPGEDGADDGAEDGAAATVPRLAAVAPDRPTATGAVPAGAGAPVRGRALVVGSVLGSAAAALAGGVLAARTLPPDELVRAVAAVALGAVTAGAAAAARRDRPGRLRRRPWDAADAADAPGARPDPRPDEIGSLLGDRGRPSSAGPAAAGVGREVS